MRLEFTIEGNPVTKKNHSRIVTAHGRTMLLPSKQYVQYEKDCAPYIPRLPEPISTPINVKATFYRQTRREVDLPNLIAALHDILVKYRVVADDSRSVIYAVDGCRVLWDKSRPRTVVEISDIPEEEFESWK